MTKSQKVKERLARYIDAGFPILYINTFEETKADKYIEQVTDRREVLEWNGADGFVDFKTKNPFMKNMSLEQTLSQLKSGKELDKKILVIKDADEILKVRESENKAVALLKDIARKIRDDIDAVVIIISPTIYIPQALEKVTTILTLELPDSDEIRTIIENFINDMQLSPVNKGLIDEMTIAFKGLSEFEIEDLLKLAIADDGELTGKDLELIFEQKQQMILKAGVLEMVPLKEDLKNIGGLENLKKWLENKAKVFKDWSEAKEFGVPMPKGVLIAGMPGCGKSLTAKAAGKLFDVPLLRLDMGRLMGKYVGESEENMSKAIWLAEAISPCILWVDELEKAFAGMGGGGSEVTTRLFGAFLTWMQEKKSPAFVVATANDISQLPPELLRKGRFDELFFVDLPKDSEREKIFKIHIEKCRQDVNSIAINDLITKTKGYCGADIEGIVGESVERAFINGGNKLTTNDILDCIDNTKSLTDIMGDKLKDLKKKYENNFKPA